MKQTWHFYSWNAVSHFHQDFFLSVIVPAQYGFYPAVCSQCGDFGSNLATICMFNTAQYKILHGNKIQ